MVHQARMATIPKTRRETEEAESESEFALFLIRSASEQRVDILFEY